MWVTIEGVNGVGKTHLAGRLARRLGSQAALISELTDAGADELGSRVIGAMAQGGDFFLRSGFPITETFALAGLKVREHEDMAGRSAPTIVIEDRGLDTVTAYQAAILGGEDATDGELDVWGAKVAAIGAGWRPPPDLTLMVIDDLDRCLARVEERERRHLSLEERGLVARVARLYQRLAEREPHRVVVVDRAGRDVEDVVGEMARCCQERLDEGHAR